MLSHTVTLWSVTELEIELFHGIFSTFKCSYFCFWYVLTFGGQHLNVRHLYQSYLCCLQWHSFSLKSAYHQTAETTRIQNGSHANSGPERSIHTMKQRIYLIYLVIWVLRLVGGWQVFSEEIKSNAVSKLFILIWSYEGMKVMNLGHVKSDGKLSITLKFEFFIMLV